MPDVIDALVTFVSGWAEVGLGSDGLPLYRETVRIRLAKPPLTEYEREATEDDYEQFHDAYTVFQRTQQGRRLTSEGYPLALWPALNRAEFEMCVARNILTVEQLAAVRGESTPPQIRELVARAKKMIKLQGELGKFEKIITELEAQVGSLTTELKEANQTISAQNALINQLRPTPVRAA